MDWSTLPGDLVRLVAGHLPDPLDFLRLRAVCRSWRSAVAFSPPPRFLPWLLARPAGAAHPTTSLSFFSLASGAARSVPAPSSSRVASCPVADRTSCPGAPCASPASPTSTAPTSRTTPG